MDAVTRTQGHHKLFNVIAVSPPGWTELLARSFPRNKMIFEYLTTAEGQPIGAWEWQGLSTAARKIGS